MGTKEKEEKSKTFRKSFIKNASLKSIVLTMAIAAVFLVATIGSASANGVCVGATTNFSCDSATGLSNRVTEDCTFNDTMNCPADGLWIWMDDITIDGDDKTIRRANTDDCGAWTGIWNPPSEWSPVHGWTYLSFANVTIKNLKVENFCSGILIEGYREPDPGTHKDFVVNNTIDNCEVCNNGNKTGAAATNGVRLSWASKCNVINSRIHDNTGKMTGGCDDGGAGIFMYGSAGRNTGNNLINNTVNDNARAGIYAKKGTSDCIVRYNTVFGNGWDAATTGFNGGIGLQCKQVVGWTVEYNTANNNIGSGIWVRGGNKAGVPEGSDVRYNIVKNNTEGIAFTAYSGGGGNATLIRNTICDNGVDITVCPACTTPDSDENTCNTTQNYNDAGATGCTYYCPGETDLTISDKYEQWFGAAYNVIYTIKNLGNSTAPESRTGIYIDDALNKTDPVGLIGPGESYIRTVGLFTMSGDNDTIEVCADYEDTINETNETNNCLENVFNRSEMPDLVIISKSEEWSSMEDKTYNISYTVKNTGTIAVDASDVGIYIDDVFNRTVSTKALAPGEEETKTIGPFTMTDGSDTIKVCADNNSIVPESDEENNCLENVAEVDLVIVSKSEDWVSIENTTYNISYTVKNTGTIGTDASDVGIYIDGVFNRTVPMNALAPGEEESKTIGPFTMTDGSDTIKVCADNNSIVPESDEENNCLENVAEVDLVIVSKSEDWVSKEDKTYNISYTVKNTGTMGADASDAGIYIDGVFNRTVPTKALAAGEEETKTIGPFTMSGENDTIKVCVDNNSVVPDINEINNCLENLFELPTIGCVAENGTLFICGELVTKSCTFNGNMNCPATGNGLVVGADNIVIDGAGYKLNGSVAGAVCSADETHPAITHSGIVNNVRNNVVIRNIEIQNFCTGIVIGRADLEHAVVSMTVTGCKIHDCGRTDAITHGIHLVGPYYCNITKNEIYNISGYMTGSCCDGGNGIFMNGHYGWEHGGGDDNTITCNRIYDVMNCGIFTRYGCMHNAMSYNYITRCPEGGIVPMCMRSDYNTYEYNNLSIESGFWTGGNHNTIRYNTAHNNPWGGIGEGNAGNIVTNNSACGNSGIDIGGDICDDNTCGSGCGCNWSCNNLTPVYFNFDGDGRYSNTTENCTCNNVLGVGACCNPGLFNASHAAMLNASGICWLVPGDDPNDCDPSIPEEKPDLVITEKSEAWINMEDKTYNVTYTVKNIGNADANESTTSIIIDGIEVETDPVELLPPQATHTAELGTFTMSGDSDTIRVCADNESVVSESREDNNCKENTFKLPGDPDLVITEKFEEWVASNEPYRNYTVTYTVKNVGTGDAGASTTSIIIDGVEKAKDSSVGALNEGDSYTNTLGPFTMSNESDTIKVCADRNNDVEESNEDNNCTENTFDYSEAGCLAEDGTLFRCGNTVTKSCTFNGDMSCPFTDGLKIGANSIIINGNNSVLDGTGCTLDAMSRSGIYNKGYDDVTIKDLEVKGFCHGLYLYGTGAEGNVYRNTIEHCDIHHNGNASTNAGIFGITMKYVYNSTIRNNTVHHQIAGINPNPGCEDGGNGMFLYKGNYNNFTYNDVYNNTKGGIFIKMQPMHNNISHNDLWDNGQGGIILRCMMSNYNTIEHNNASNNYGSGIFIGAKENTIRYNTVCDNRDGGLYYQDSVGGHGYGINLGRSDGSFDNCLHDNEICGNDYKDIYVVSGVTGNHGEDNTCDTTYNYDDTGTTGCTYPCAPGVCGDVEGLPGVTTNDGRQIFMYLLYGEEQYPIHDLWAADCDGLCEGITTNDGRQIFMNLLYGEEEYPLVCC